MKRFSKIEWGRTSRRAAAWMAIAVTCLAQCSFVQADDLDDAFAGVVTGRSYLKDYPALKTRNQLVDDFIGANGHTPNRPALMQAVDRAVMIRRQELPEAPTFPAGQAPRSVQAKVIAWEALESLLTGYMFAGNRDLLAATRIAYPGSNLANDSRQLPAEESMAFAGTSQKQISYARLYFLQGIKDVLAYVAEDPSGALRAGGSTFPTIPHYVVFDDEQGEILPFPRFDDPNFGGPSTQDREPSQSVAYLYGSNMDRLGLAAVSYADQLWRSAYSGPTSGSRRPDAEKAAMLQRAADVLRENIHAEFLSALPMAAQLSDGANGSVNEFQQSKIDQARVTVTSALRLREQILAGEKPTQTALVSAWDTTSIEQQIGRCRDAEDAARTKWGGDASPPADGSVAFELERTEQAQSLNAEREISLRNSMESQLFEITGIDPSIYGGLRTAEDRAFYLADVRNKFDTLLNERNANAPGLLDGSTMSVQALRLIQAIKEAEVASARIQSFALKMNTELERNFDVNATLVINSVTFSAIELALGAAYAAPQISVCACGMASGVTTHYSPGAIPAAMQAALRILRVATETVVINSVNSDALIKNLLIDQQVAIEELGVTELNSSIAGAELRSLFARANRLVEDHIFFQGMTDTLWYRDPSLAFKLEKAEEEYQGLLQEYRIELYKLARMLEAQWTERFQNPVKQANGSSVQPLNNGSFDEFTEAESVFGVVNHVRGRAFFNALKAWDLKLREPLFRGPYNSTLWDANSFSGQPISLRRDIFKLIDYRYDFAGNRYEVDAGLTRQTIQQFRALLLDLATRDSVNEGGLSRLRIDFPLTYNQARVILGQQSPVPIVQQNRPGGTFDQFWNHRVKEIGVKIVGKNVFAAGSTVPISFELFGNVDRIGFFPDSLFTFSRTISSFQVPLYQRDPDRRLIGEPFFGTGIGIPAAIGSTPVTMNQVNGWPLFCDRIVLRFGSQGSLRIENIEDIELHLKMEVGSPPPISSAVW
ncbi:MAG TPA: hypothetical protein VJS65_01120 [Verrucomicrobiae bacterium]|nr:hypothetical protein [Verrucomicrobiae bacterium]